MSKQALYALKARIAAFEVGMAVIEAEEIKGGAGSGNWGHAGRAGKRGGSAPKKGPTGGGYNPAMSSYSGPTAKKRQALARVKGEPGGFGVALSGHKELVTVDGYLYGNGSIGVYYNKDDKEWNVIHTQSGIALGVRSKNPLTAMELAKEFEKTDIDFTNNIGSIVVNGNTMGKLNKLAEVAYNADKTRDPEGPDALGLPPKPKAPPKPAKVIESATGTEAGGKAPTGKAAPPGTDKTIDFLSDGVKQSYGYDRDPDKRLARMLDATDDSRRDAKIDIMNKLAEKSGLPAKTTDSMVRTWADTSADSDIDALKMQESAAKMLGREPSDYVKKKLKELEKYADTPKYSDSDREKFLKAMYEHTQDEFAKAGLKPTDTIRVYRGVNSIPELKNANHGDEVSITQNPMTSWSLSRNLASGFTYGSLDSGNGLLTMDVPVSAIMGSCRTGFGCLSEAEVVIADVGKHTAIVENKNIDSVLQ